jgi:NMD protein affecting ribosome stability and mRNA decay
MAKIAIEINSCKNCPFFDERNPWSSDSWDRMIDWYCKKSEKVIEGSVEWHEEKKIQIPDWCEIKIQ